MPDGFRAQLDSLHGVAVDHLPAIADVYGKPLPALSAPARFGPGSAAASGAVEAQYADYATSLLRQQRRLVEAVRETAETLSEIVALYRRADGQG